MRRPEQDLVNWKVDREAKLARASLGSTTREARYYGGQGCIIQDPASRAFTSNRSRSGRRCLTHRRSRGRRATRTGGAPGGFDPSKLQAATEAAFGDPAALTAAFLVVHKGRIVAERYAPGITKDTQLESWSMGKSLATTLFALLVKDAPTASSSRRRCPCGRNPVTRAPRSATSICCG